MSDYQGFDKFRQKYPLRPMRKIAANDDELRQMGYSDGIINLEEGPDATEYACTISESPTTEEEASHNRYLWVVRNNDVPCALEGCKWGQSLANKKIKHSNLTGGGPAHSGGELWVVEGKGLIINADSGRYGALTESELDDFIDELRKIGFCVASMGFDVDNPSIPNRVQVGPAQWRDAL